MAQEIRTVSSCIWTVSRKQARQVSTLLYCMGEEAEDVLTSTNITTDEKKDYETVLDKFNEYFKVRKNVIFERARFNRRNQLKGESVEQYITDLYRLAETCEYGDMTSQMIRDRLVVGIQNLKLSEQLQMDPNLTLETAKKLIRQHEAVQEHQAILQQAGNSDKPPAVEHIRYKKPVIYPLETHQHNSRLNVSAVETNHMLSTNVLQESPHATNVRGKATTVASVFQKQCLKSQQDNLKKT